MLSLENNQSQGGVMHYHAKVDFGHPSDDSPHHTTSTNQGHVKPAKMYSILLMTTIIQRLIQSKVTACFWGKKTPTVFNH